MSDLLAARAQMAISLGFHIVFAAIGIALPALMVLAEARGLRLRDPVYREIAKAWARGAAIFFAVGAVSGTVLSFELGLLWPAFMQRAGPLIGLPFALEGFAFFTEAIFLGVYLYGWDRVSPAAHMVAGVLVAASGAASALFVLGVNGWMNAPTGFTLAADGSFENVDPLAALANPFWIPSTIHMLIGAYQATAFGAAGIHAAALLREPGHVFHREALRMVLFVAALTSLLQPISGDLNARRLHTLQPSKLAAMEGQFQSQECAPLRIGGFPSVAEQRTRGALEIPCGLSLMVAHDPGARVLGLDAFPENERPDPRPVHLAFQLMVAIGSALALLGACGAWVAWKHGARIAEHRRLLALLVAAAPLGFVAIEAGWVVTELGRQPWIIFGVMRVDEALTPMPGIVVSLALYSAIYLGLTAIVVQLMRRQVQGVAELRDRRP